MRPFPPPNFLNFLTILNLDIHKVAHLLEELGMLQPNMLVETAFRPIRLLADLHRALIVTTDFTGSPAMSFALLSGVLAAGVFVAVLELVQPCLQLGFIHEELFDLGHKGSYLGGQHHVR
jgi:hypothetical protein